MYDIRSRQPLYTKEHQYDLPIIDVSFHNEGNKHVLSTDSKIVKIWKRDGEMGKILTNIETPVNINALQIVGDKRGQSGLLMMAGEQSRVMTYFIPQLGPAPRWCSFLEGITEDLEESAQQSVYDDFKFITKTEVEELGATGLIGTPMLKSYMHGYFIDMKLYSKLRAVSKPFEYEEHRKRLIKDKIEEKRKSRIIAQKRLPKVNKDLALKLEKKGISEGGAIDDRFAALFKRDEFQQDPESQEYLLRNPTKGQHSRKERGDDSDDDLEDDAEADLFEQVSMDDESSYSGNDGGGDDFHLHDSYEDDLEPIVAEGMSMKSRLKSGGKKRGKENDDEGDIIRASKALVNKRKEREQGKKPIARNAPKMFEVSPAVNFGKVAFAHTAQAKELKDRSKSTITLPLDVRYFTLLSEPHCYCLLNCVYGRASSLPSSSAAGSKVKHFKAGDRGTVSEMSYIPAAPSKSKKSKR